MGFSDHQNDARIQEKAVIKKDNRKGAAMKEWTGMIKKKKNT